MTVLTLKTLRMSVKWHLKGFKSFLSMKSGGDRKSVLVIFGSLVKLESQSDSTSLFMSFKQSVVFFLCAFRNQTHEALEGVWTETREDYNLQ